uniref:NB-ARC domain-containing protein n=1 Tax=Salix viminalis TaxID=40686 RepID=A0A6N2KPN8_SALVM
MILAVKRWWCQLMLGFACHRAIILRAHVRRTIIVLGCAGMKVSPVEDARDSVAGVFAPSFVKLREENENHENCAWTGSFAKAFDKHEECFKEKVKEWRKALEEAGNLSGWNLNDMENRCFLSNINETSEQPNGLAHLQEQLLHDILKQNVATINNADRGMVLIKERLCHKRVIIVVVDDVAQQYQLNALVGERSWFGPGSRVIITTKDERLLLKVDRKFKVEELKRDASLQLFSWHAFRDKPSKDYVELSNDVVDYCGGIPLALEVLGSSLSAKNKSRWKCVIDKLRIIPNHDIQEKLRICFDKLDDHKLQKTFLDLACFFIGRNKEYVSHVLEARCGYNPEDDLGTLGERSLIKINASGEISMHNLLRDMGREIIHKESPDHPGKRSRIWQQQPNGLALLQEQLLHDILKQNVATINNADRGMVLIKERLCHKRVIVVVDDVAQHYQLIALVGERSWFGPGSRAIITTKDERLLLKVDQKFKVEELKRDASLQLFSWHAFRDNKPSKGYVELSNDVVDYCGGIPLALEVLGSSLSVKNKSRWKCVIDKLRIIPNHDIHEKLRICFDKLDDHKLQKTFLDLACFFIGRNKEYVSHVLEARCGYNPEDDLGTLGERSLIKVNASGEISMHNLLRDMGREIIHKESPDHPGKRSRIWQREDAWNVLSKQMLIWICWLECPLKSFPSDFMLDKLVVLEMQYKELIWICWLECPLKSFPSDLMFDNLVVLEMQYKELIWICWLECPLKSFPSDFMLDKLLIWICWLECPLKFFPSDLMLDKLVVLEMQRDGGTS